jgi:hypothetical protein
MNGQPSIWPSAHEWWEALRWVSFVFTGLIALTLAGSFVSFETVVTNGHPWLPRAHCPGCSFCGMTRSFCALSSLHWQEAWQWNRGGPLLYVSGWLWLGGTLIVAIRSARQSWHQRRTTDWEKRR